MGSPRSGCPGSTSTWWLPGCRGKRRRHRAGTAARLREVLTDVRRRGIFCRTVKVDYASHSPQVESLRERLTAELAYLTPRAGTVPIHSTTLDAVVDGSGFDGQYWMGNLRLPVRFAPAVRAAVADHRHTLFVEVSPHPVLLDPITDEIDEIDEIDAADGVGSAVGSLHRDESSTVLLRALGYAYTRGCELLSGVRFPVSPATTEAPRPGTSAERVRELVAQVLQVPSEDVDRDKPLGLFGLDPLMAAELRVRLRQDLGVDMPVRALLGGGTVSTIARAAG